MMMMMMDDDDTFFSSLFSLPKKQFRTQIKKESFLGFWCVLLLKDDIFFLFV